MEVFQRQETFLAACPEKLEADITNRWGKAATITVSSFGYLCSGFSSHSDWKIVIES